MRHRSSIADASCNCCAADATDPSQSADTVIALGDPVEHRLQARHIEQRAAERIRNPFPIRDRLRRPKASGCRARRAAKCAGSDFNRQAASRRGSLAIASDTAAACSITTESCSTDTARSIDHFRREFRQLLFVAGQFRAAVVEQQRHHLRHVTRFVGDALQLGLQCRGTDRQLRGVDLPRRAARTPADRIERRFSIWLMSDCRPADAVQSIDGQDPLAHFCAALRTVIAISTAAAVRGSPVVAQAGPPSCERAPLCTCLRRRSGSPNP